MKDALGEKITQLGHEHMGLGKMAHGHGEASHVIMMAMGEGDGVYLLPGDLRVEREARPALAFGVDAGVHQQAMAVDLGQPRAGPDIAGGV